MFIVGGEEGDGGPAEPGGGDILVPADAEISISCRTTWGKIVYYIKSDRFEAVCPNRQLSGLHDCKCSMVRTAKPSTKGAQGRPLGFLAAWLFNAFDIDPATKAAHQAHRPSLEEREVARVTFRNLFPEFALLEERERPRRADEGEEPKVCA